MRNVIFAVFVLFVFTGFTMLAQQEAASAKPEQTPVVKEVEGFWYGYMEFKGSYSKMQTEIQNFMNEFFKQGLIPAGVAVSAYFNSSEEVKEEDLRWAFGFVITKETTVKEPIKKMEFKKQKAVVYLHKGPYENLPKSYDMVWKFIKDKEYKIIWPVYDRYLNNPMQVEPEKLETEIVVPIKEK